MKPASSRARKDKFCTWQIATSWHSDWVKSYGQYCPISRATEILGERWTLLVVRNLLLGCRTFNSIAGGVPGMSRSLLTARLRELESAGLVVSQQKTGRRGREYELTEAGRDLWNVIGPLAAWGRRWIELQPEHADPSFVLWAWVHAHLDRQRLPAQRVVVRFTFPELSPPHHRFWVLFDGDATELCSAPPKYPHDLDVEAKSEAFTLWHIGRLSWGAATRSGAISVVGNRALARALPTWNGRAVG